MFTLPNDYHTSKIKCSHYLWLVSTSSLNTFNSKTSSFVFTITDFLFFKISLSRKSVRLRCWVYQAEIGADMAMKRPIVSPLLRTPSRSNACFSFHISLNYCSVIHSWSSFPLRSRPEFEVHVRTRAQTKNLPFCGGKKIHRTTRLAHRPARPD